MESIITDKPDKADPLVQDDPARTAMVIELEVDPAPLQESQVTEAATRPYQPGSVQETIMRVMVETGAMIDIAMEALKSGGAPALSSEP